MRIIGAGCVIIAIEIEVNDMAKPADGTLNEDGWVSVNDLVVHPDSPVGGGGGGFFKTTGIQKQDRLNSILPHPHSGDA